MFHHYATTEMVYNSLGTLLSKIKTLSMIQNADLKDLVNKALQNYEELADFIFSKTQVFEKIKNDLYVPKKGEIPCRPVSQELDFSISEKSQLELKSLDSLDNLNSYLKLGKNIEEIDQFISNTSDEIAIKLIFEVHSFYKQLNIEFEFLHQDIENYPHEYKTK